MSTNDDCFFDGSHVHADGVSADLYEALILLSKWARPSFEGCGNYRADRQAETEALLDKYAPTLAARGLFHRKALQERARQRGWDG